MDRQTFWFLYANVNSIAELGFKQLAAQILADPGAGAGSQDQSSQEHVSDEEQQARMMAGFENLDWSALEGLGAAKDADEPLSAADLAGFEGLTSERFELIESEESEAPGEELDMGQYLSRAYAHEEELRELVDTHYRRADLTAMQAALAQLPGALPPLTSRLTAEDVTEWLKVYDQENAALNNLTLLIRQLDTAGGQE